MSKSKKYTTTGGLVPNTAINTSSFSMTGLGSSINTSPNTTIIADGKNMIVCYDSPGIREVTYFCIKDIQLNDLNFEVAFSSMPSGTLNFNFLNSESRSFKIPDHIPKEQHVAYIKEQFNLD